MELYWINTETRDNNLLGLDLEEVWGESEGVDDFKLNVIHVMAIWAIEKGFGLDKVTSYTLDHDGEEMIIEGDAEDWGWLDKVAEIVSAAYDRQNHVPVDAFMAYIDGTGWNYFRPDVDLRYIREQFYQEFDGDHEEFAMEHMANCGESIPDHMDHHFDYQSYGESLIEDFEVHEWGDTKYLFTH